jgi:hypothetical protein
MNTDIAPSIHTGEPGEPRFEISRMVLLMLFQRQRQRASETESQRQRVRDRDTNTVTHIFTVLLNVTRMIIY